MMQVIANQIQTRAEYSTVQEMLVCSKDIVDWYITSKGQEFHLSVCGALRSPCCHLLGASRPHRFEPASRVAQPAFAPTGNTLVDHHGALVRSLQWQACSIHTSEVKITITSRTEGAEIYYRIVDAAGPDDGGAPSRDGPGSRRYRKPVVLAHDGVGHREFLIQAVALCEGMQPSRVGLSPLYRVQARVRPVVFREVRGGEEVLLSMQCATPGATVHYVAGTDQPTGESPAYGGPMRVHTRLVRAFARAPGMTDSEVATHELKAQAAAPAISGAGETRLSTELHARRRQVFLDEVRARARLTT